MLQKVEQITTKCIIIFNKWCDIINTIIIFTIIVSILLSNWTQRSYNDKSCLKEVFSWFLDLDEIKSNFCEFINHFEINHSPLF